MKTMILYFSGTGNTEYTAQKMAHNLKEMQVEYELHSIEEKFILNPDSFDRLILGCPKYYEYPALFFIKYLKKHLPKSRKPIPVFFFCTQCGPLDTDTRKIGNLLKKKNYTLIMTKSFPIANNFSIYKIFPLTAENKYNENLKNMEQALKPLLTDFIKISAAKNPKKENPSIEKQSFFIRNLCWLCGIVCTKLFALFAVKYSPSSACTGCGLCAKNCPTGNIQMHHQKPVFGKKCIFCMRCFSSCPSHAILYNKKECPQYKFQKKKMP